MLWAPANGKVYKDSKQYGEIIENTQNKKRLQQKNKTGDEILEDVTNTLLKISSKGKEE